MHGDAGQGVQRERDVLHALETVKIEFEPAPFLADLRAAATSHQSSVPVSGCCTLPLKDAS